MIEQLNDFPQGTLAFKVSGHVTGDDYDRVLTPAIDAGIQEYERIRLFIQIGPDFEGYSLDAAWDDTRLGLRHWRGFERAAVVTDVGWIGTGVKGMSFLMPYPINLFELDEADEAKRWLSESLGSIRIDFDGEEVTVTMLGKLEPSAYEGIGDELDAHLARHPRINLLLDLREFDGWQGLAAVGEHFSLVREHRKAPKRLAVVGNKDWHHLAERVFSKFTNAEARYYDAEDFDDAKEWIDD